MIGRYTRQGLVLAVILGGTYLVLAQLLVGSALALVDIDADFRDLTAGYVKAITLGAPAICAFLALRFTSEGIGYTRPIMYTSLLALAANVFFNYVFMYGRFGAPAMGAVGCGLASAVTMWLMLAVLGTYVLLHPRYRPLGIFARVPPVRMDVLREIVVLGAPIAVTITAEVGLFAAVSILMGTLSVEITAAHQIAINFASTMFMVPLALSSAITIRIGHALGAGNAAAARFSGTTGISMCALFMAVAAVSLLLFRDGIVSLYTDDPAVRAIAVNLLLMAAVFQVADGVQIGAAGALRGYKDTRVPMVVNTVSYWVLAFPLAWLAAITYEASPEYIWGGFVLGLSVAAILLTIRFRKVSAR
jgi:MATE family multidrug resistance protein